MTNYKSIIEAILFSSGEPVSVERISLATGLEMQETISFITDLSGEYDEKHSGIKIISINDSYQMCSRGEYFDYVRTVMDMRRNAPLSPASLEVLAVIAYNQPVTKAFIEQVRGVDCSGVISGLIDKALIAEQGRLDLPGRPLLYGTTDDFLRCFSLRTLADLPPLPLKEEEQMVMDMTPKTKETKETENNETEEIKKQ